MESIKSTAFILFTLLVAFSLGCQSPPTLSPGEGFVEIPGGKVWYRIVGEGDQTPLLLLHGGPGFPSYYLNPMSALSQDRPVIFIDQLGCGRSDRTLDSTMMTVDSFVEQLEQIRVALGLETFYLYGHSWGSMLGVDYFLKYPDRVKAMVLASPALSVSKWSKDAEALIANLPDSIQSAIATNTENGTFETPAYQEAINVFYQNFVAKKLPWDANMDSTFAGANLEQYSYMWGPSEFMATGVLKDYERGDQLKKIKVPTLFICGEYDEARPSTVQYFQSLVPNAKFSMIKDAAHITMHDNPEQNNQVIGNFLRELTP